KAAARNTLHVGDKTSNTGLGTSTSIDNISIYEGIVTFTLDTSNNELIVDDGVNKTIIYVTEINWLGNQTTNRRVISSSITGDCEVKESFTVTLNY
ncbi:MAG: hypothetical protein ACI4MC_07180, partial [Candidatus Coproplasma sp.]